MESSSPLSHAEKHHLWEPPNPSDIEIPYSLRLSVLNDQTEHGDCPAKVFTFPSLVKLSEATHKIEESFEGSGYEIRKVGVEVQGSEYGRHASGRLESIVIDFNSGKVEETWNECKSRVQDCEKEWKLKMDNF